MVQHLTTKNFDQTIKEDKLTVVDFWAAWCGPCRAMAPQFELASELRPQYAFGKVDVDAEPLLAQRYGIQAIPTLIVFKAGKPVAAQAGLVPANQLVQALDRLNEKLAAEAGSQPENQATVAS
jgi:thioredoxin